MMRYIQFIFIFSCFTTIAVSESCEAPALEVKSFTTQDATIITNIAYISEFKIKCQSGNIDNLYADVEGNIGPVSQVGPQTYQVSWVEEVKTARSGDRIIRLFDEEGYTSLKKAIRAEQDTSKIKSIASVVLNHPGAFSGPWFKSESIALIVGLIVVYIAISSRSKLSS